MPNLELAYKDDNLWFYLVRDESSLSTGIPAYTIEHKTMSKDDLTSSKLGGFIDWPMCLICLKAFEYCDPLSNSIAEWCGNMWNFLGKPRRQQVLNVVEGGPLPGSSDILGRDLGFEAYTFAVYYTAIKMAMKYDIKLNLFEFKTIEFFLDALNEFGWLVGDLNYDNTEVQDNEGSPWRFPLPKDLCAALETPSCC
eukprot:TRINITY_DN144_c0_g1_i2.p1 TRINITY_DN144_c0_g1~~TRINITY_DN144_c0_g1_i2.p1  ORF type:complete len:196 (+),score=7.14 TRINITY_DN144_c0_g1_i2:863-1450(+)